MRIEQISIEYPDYDYLILEFKKLIHTKFKQDVYMIHVDDTTTVLCFQSFGGSVHTTVNIILKKLNDDVVTIHIVVGGGSLYLEEGHIYKENDYLCMAKTIQLIPKILEYNNGKFLKVDEEFLKFETNALKRFFNFKDNNPK